MNARDQHIGASCLRLTGFPNIARLLFASAERARSLLRDDPARPSASVAIDPRQFGSALAFGIDACVVCVVRAGSAGPLVRDLDADRYMLSLRGAGRVRLCRGEQWNIGYLRSEGALEDRWQPVPRGAWHQPEAQDEDWVVAQFHMSGAQERSGMLSA